MKGLLLTTIKLNSLPKKIIYFLLFMCVCGYQCRLDSNTSGFIAKKILVLFLFAFQ